ncbi:MAG: hypothetical protein LBD72_02030 [Puniceicoccales bacterium]|jgi:hypothetical protein|nr:hypothetical protein [Puniceicoccales bacterium]
MSIVSSPVNFKDLITASVYYEILKRNLDNLQPISPEIRFEKNTDGTMSYYRILANGGYTRAKGNCGEFVKMTTDDGREVFLHYSQVFGPTFAARKSMDTLAYVLGATYQNTYRQMAMLNDLINEAEALNESMRKFNDIFSSFTTNAINYNSGAINQILTIHREMLKLYIDSGLQIPLNRICSGAAPQLYAEIVHSTKAYDTSYYQTWTLFYVDASGNKKIVRQGVEIKHEPTGSFSAEHNNVDPPAYSLSEYLSFLSDMMNNEVAIHAQFSSDATYSIESGDSKFFAKCYFDNGESVRYKYFLGLSIADKDVDLRKAQSPKNIVTRTATVNANASCYSCPVQLEEVLNGNKIGYFSQKESNSFLDQIRIAIDQLNNKLSTVSSVIGIYNQDLQQNYAVATSALEATEEAQQKTAKNIR